MIPTLNEADNIARLLGELDRESEPHEVIVVDGGSADRSVSMSEAAGARVLRSAANRGAQLAAGAATASGEILLFLHADSMLGTGALSAIACMLANRPDIVGGNFHMLFVDDNRFNRWLTGFCAWIRTRGYYYGDSGIFVRREIYGRLGGFRPMALMEDYEFVRRLEATGSTCCISDPPLTTSSRRFHGRHPVAIFCGWVCIHALYALGVSPGWLAWIYRSSQHSPGRRINEPN